MKPFESSIGPLLKDYISYRAGLGYGEKELRRILIWLDRYIQEQKAGLGDLTPVFFLGLKKSHEKKRSSFNALLRAARGFFAYLERRRIVSENPLLDIESYPRNAFIPFVFSPEKTDALLFAAQKNIRKEDPDSFLRDYSAYLVIVLLARCGMRIKEPLHLTLQDYRPAEKTLYIEKTKFHKDRLIPVPTAAAMELDTYLRIRGSFVTGNKYLRRKEKTSATAGVIAKVDASKPYKFNPMGQYYVVPVIAKVDALKVRIYEISTFYP
jgi:site-specific recombinase XerD